uniref:Uncharacterized protein n=1 Tax=Timema genevievae TaxID=629358 RepID=A0A7R9JZ32_TIMGE|nr:unnamed protein product [Timema genevievae]
MVFRITLVKSNVVALPFCAFNSSAMFDQLKGKLNLNVDDIDKLTTDDLRTQVDFAIRDGTPVEYLKHKECTCTCPDHNISSSKAATSRNLRGRSEDEIRQETVNVMKKAATLLQIFTAAHFGCGSEHFKRNKLKRSSKGNHWGDLRARLEMSVNYVIELMSNPDNCIHSDYTSDSEDAPIILCNAKLASAVRKQLTPSIRDLIQHGLMPIGQSESIVPFVGCFTHMNSAHEKTIHAWELILKYYEMKNGDRFNSTPARKLSLSFNLNIVGGTAISNKQPSKNLETLWMDINTPLATDQTVTLKFVVCLLVRGQI